MPGVVGGVLGCGVTLGCGAASAFGAAPVVWPGAVFGFAALGFGVIVPGLFCVTVLPAAGGFCAVDVGLVDELFRP